MVEVVKYFEWSEWNVHTLEFNDIFDLKICVIWIHHRKRRGRFSYCCERFKLESMKWLLSSIICKTILVLISLSCYLDLLSVLLVLREISSSFESILQVFLLMPIEQISSREFLNQSNKMGEKSFINLTPNNWFVRSLKIKLKNY